jgi:hypothetical protein
MLTIDDGAPETLESVIGNYDSLIEAFGQLMLLWPPIDKIRILRGRLYHIAQDSRKNCQISMAKRDILGQIRHTKALKRQESV